MNLVIVQLEHYVTKRGHLVSTKLRRIQLIALLLMLIGFSQKLYFVACCFGVISIFAAFYRR